MPEHRPEDFRPTASWANLKLRAELLRRLRTFFDERGFVEVQTPVLSADTVVDRHLDPFCVDLHGGRRMWLQTSPEFAMKRMLAAGAGAIYQVGPVFRQAERGPLHNPEFTMVEWYRPGDGPEQGMALTDQLCQALLNRGPAERVSYGEAFRRHAGLDPHTAATDLLRASAARFGIAVPDSLSPEDRDGWLDLLLVERVQPHLGIERPSILYDYPASQAALARIRREEPPLAERFELYVDGIELANGYHELLDAEELRSRNRQANSQRQADGKPPLPEQSRLIDAMQSGLPASVGVALGFDRLVTVAVGAKSLAEVMPFPWDRA